jgi:hypothetical protein
MAIESTGIGENLTAIASGLLGIALIALIVSQAKNVNSIVQTAGQTYGGLLSTVINPGQAGAGFVSRVGQ